MSKMVGDSEKRIEQALRVTKACAPCVLLIDEAEKLLGGISSSNNSDSGTLSRVVSKLLQFLNQDDNDVFVVMTSNDVSQLPPELTRSGRLDAQWYFGLPNLNERKEIFRIHFKKNRQTPSDLLVDYAAKETENYTGAEIRDIVKFSLRKAYFRYKTDGNREIARVDIKQAIDEVIPLYESSREKIMGLERYAKNRARYVSGNARTAINESSDKILARRIDIDIK